jgi:hypothetical protein
MTIRASERKLASNYHHDEGSMLLQQHQSCIDVVAIPRIFPSFRHRVHRDALTHHHPHVYHRADKEQRSPMMPG